MAAVRQTGAAVIGCLGCVLQESRRQAEYDEVLRDAKMLRQDLDHEQERCRNKQRSLLDQKRDLDARITRLSGGKQGMPPHLTREAAEADHHAKEVCPSGHVALVPFMSRSSEGEPDSTFPLLCTNTFTPLDFVYWNSVVTL